MGDNPLYHPVSAGAWRPSIWSASAPEAARTGPACGPAPEGNPGHAGLELWVAVCGHQVVSGPAVSPAGAKDEEG